MTESLYSLIKHVIGYHRSLQDSRCKMTHLLIIPWGGLRKILFCYMNKYDLSWIGVYFKLLLHVADGQFLRYEQMEIFLGDPVFIFPQLLPESRFVTNQINKASAFTEAEDKYVLVLWGIFWGFFVFNYKSVLDEVPLFCYMYLYWKIFKFLY